MNTENKNKNKSKKNAEKPEGMTAVMVGNTQPTPRVTQLHAVATHEEDKVWFSQLRDKHGLTDKTTFAIVRALVEGHQSDLKQLIAAEEQKLDEEAEARKQRAAEKAKERLERYKAARQARSKELGIKRGRKPKAKEEVPAEAATAEAK